jgi:hypothetical protein
MPSAHWTMVGLAILVIILGSGYALSRGTGRIAPRGTWFAGCGAAAFGVIGLLALSWLAPSGTYPANLGAGQGGSNFWGILPVSAGSDTLTRERLVWAAQRNGALELAPHLPRGRYAIVVRAGAQAMDGAPSLVVRLSAEPVLDVPLESATPPVWREQDYRTEIEWRGGRLPIRLELGRISRRNPARFAYIDAIEIRRLTR